MGFGKPPGVPCPPRNPHCQGLDPVEADITSCLFAIIIVIAIFAVVFFNKYPKKRIYFKKFIKSKLSLFSLKININDDNVFIKFIWVCMFLGLAFWTSLIIYLIKTNL